MFLWLDMVGLYVVMVITTIINVILCFYMLQLCCNYVPIYSCRGDIYHIPTFPRKLSRSFCVVFWIYGFWFHMSVIMCRPWRKLMWKFHDMAILIMLKTYARENWGCWYLAKWLYMHMDMQSVLVGLLSVTHGQRCVGIPITNEIPFPI